MPGKLFLSTLVSTVNEKTSNALAACFFLIKKLSLIESLRDLPILLNRIDR